MSFILEFFLLTLFDYIIVYYSIGFKESALKFWRQFSNFWDGALLIRCKFNAGFWKPILYNILSYTLFNVLIDAIKPNVDKKFKTCFIFYATV